MNIAIILIVIGNLKLNKEISLLNFKSLFNMFPMNSIFVLILILMVFTAIVYCIA